MHRPFALALAGCLTAGAITALTILALEAERGRFDRSSIANLAGAPLDVITTGSIASRDETDAHYSLRLERLNESLQSQSMKAAEPVRCHLPEPQR